MNDADKMNEFSVPSASLRSFFLNFFVSFVRFVFNLSAMQ